MKSKYQETNYLSNLSGVTLQSLEVALNDEFKPRNDLARELVQEAVHSLAEFALVNQNLINEDSIKTIEAIIAELDQVITEQLNEIIHHEDFQALESAWRGLNYLVKNTETSNKLKIRVMDVSKKDLARSLKAYEGHLWDQSPIFKKIYEQEFGQFGGEPYGCIVGDYYFDQSKADVELLESMSKIASSAHCPFIAGADPNVMNMDNWGELGNPIDLAKIFSTPEYSAWNELRESSDSRYVALTLPRFALRGPFGQCGEHLTAMPFEEDITDDAKHVVWGNASYAMAVNINKAFAQYGWCSQINGVESGGLVNNLPLITNNNKGFNGSIVNPVETGISDRRESELTKAGFMPLIYKKNSDAAVFMGARSLHSPQKYENMKDAENAEISTRLPYIFAVSRFAHYIKCIARDKVGSFKSVDEIQRWLNEWIVRYVDGDPTISSQEVKARRPLSEAKVVVEEIPGDLGKFHTTFYLKPHFQLEALTVSLRLVSEIPSGKNNI